MLGGQAAWNAHAATLAARMAHLQITVEPDWHYAVCASCGWELEHDRTMRAAFRYEVATHECGLLMSDIPDEIALVMAQTALQMEMF